MLALYQQLAVLQRSIPRPRLRNRDRLFWIVLARLSDDWRFWLKIVKPESVTRWQQRRFKSYWQWKCKTGRVGRPKLEKEVRQLIRRMSRENVFWRIRRIQSELRLLGYDVAASTVSKYKVRGNRPPSQSWEAFLKNHVGEIAAIDFFTVPTAPFRILYCLVVLCHDRRQVVHFNVTAHPTEQWTVQPVIEAFPYDQAPQYLLRDRDGIYGDFFRGRVQGMGMREVRISPRSPGQNPFVERVVGSIRRECLDHVMVLGERHLKRILTAYFSYYHECRPHSSLERNSPMPREVEPPAQGRIVAIPQVGGIHHRYQRVA